MILFSYPVHRVLFEKYWDMVSITRPMDAWQVIPGMAIITIGFGILLSSGFSILHRSIPGTGLKKGMNYGLLIWLIFILFAEVWNYLQFDIPIQCVAAGLIHYFITLPLGGIAMAAISGESLKD